MNYDRQIGKLMRQFVKLAEMRTRMIVPHPDCCLFLSNYPRLDWRYLKKIGAKKGHFVVSFGWLRASIAW